MLPVALRYVSIRAGAGALGLCSYIAFSRTVAPDSYGQYALLVAAAGGITACLYSWIGISLVRHLPDRETSESTHISSAIAAFGMATGLLVCACLGALMLPDNLLRRLDIALCLLLTTLTGWFEISAQISRARMQSWAYGIKTLLRYGALLGLGLAFVGIGMRGFGLVLAHSMGLVLAGLYGLRTDAASFAVTEIRRETLRQMLHYGYPVAFALTMAWVVDLSDRYLVLWLLGDAAAGRYALAYDFAKQPVWLLMSGAALSILPQATRAYRAKGPVGARSISARSLTVLLLLGMPPLALEVLLPGRLAQLLLGAEYAEVATKLMPVVALAMMLNALRSYYLDISLHLLKRTRLMVGMWIVMAVANVALNLFLIPKLGSLGAAYATLCAHAISVVYYFTVMPGPNLLGVSFRDLSKIAVGTVILIVCLAFDFTCGSNFWFLAQIILGITAYGATAFVLNIAGARSLFSQRDRVGDFA